MNHFHNYLCCQRQWRNGDHNLKKKKICLTVFIVLSICLSACGSSRNESDLSGQVPTQETVEEQDTVGSGGEPDSIFEEDADQTDLEQE